MRLLLLSVLTICLVATAAHGQTRLPKLEELEQANMLKQQQGLLTALQTNLLKRVTSRIIQECVADPGPGDATTVAETFSQLRARRIKLSSTRTAVIVQGSACMCGAVGNCSFWLISDDARPRLLLKTIGIQTFATQAMPKTSEYDLVLGSHDSAFQTDLQWFRWNGQIYRRYRCATVTWSDLDGQLYKAPRVENGSCR